MPRKDRRFKADDIARLWCKNLDENQREFALALMSKCEEEVDEEMFLAWLIRQVADLVELIPKPGTKLVAETLRLLAYAVQLNHTEEQIREYLSIEEIGM